MFPASIGAYNQRTRIPARPVAPPQPQPVAKRAPETKPENEHGHGQRKAGEISLTGKPKDPTADLAKQILGS